MEKFGLQNFRRFKDYTQINLGKVTFLVGENNSGKSSFVKSMILSQQNLQHLFVFDGNTSLRPMFFFDMEHLNIGTAERALCNNSENHEISFYVHEGSIDYTIIVKCPQRGHNHTEAPIARILINYLDEGSSIEFDFIKRKIYAHVEPYKQKILSILAKKKDALEKTYNLLKQTRPNVARRVKLDLDQTNAAMSHPEGGEVTISMPPKINIVKTGICDGVIPYLIQYVTEYYSKRGKDKQAATFFYNNAMHFPVLHLIYNSSYFDNGYIYAHGATQHVLYKCEDRSDYVAQSITNFCKAGIKEYSKEYDFICKWMQLFHIGKSIQITSFYGDSYAVEIIGEDGSIIPLGDKGMGTIQIVSLLLRLAVLIKNTDEDSKIVILEEPEINLHPAIQGQIAQLFYELSKETNYQFIIETHSEYILRHSQVIVAQIAKNEKCTTQEELDLINPFRVHYVTKLGEILDINYQIKGNFDHPFEPGFFDVADQLAMKIMF